MGLKEEVLGKIPDHLKKEPEFKALLEHIKEKGLEEKEELLDFLRTEIKMVEKWLEENKRKGGRVVKDFRDKAVRLGVLKKCEELVGVFLF